MNNPGINTRGTLEHLLKLIFIIVIVVSIGYIIEKNSYIYGMFSPVSLLIEFFFVFVSLSIFAMTWFAYSQNQDDHTLFMGATFLIIGIFQLFHVLSYPFMPDFITLNTPQKATIFIEVIHVITAPLFLISAYLYKDTLQLLNKYILFISAIILSLIPLTTIYYIRYTITDYSGMYSPEGEPSDFEDFSLIVEYFNNLIASYIYSKRFKQSEERI